MPLFLPAEPEIWSWIWTHSDPFAGPGFPQKQLRSTIDLKDSGPEWWKDAGGSEMAPFHAFDHLKDAYSLRYSMDQFVQKAYWFQYTEFHQRPHMRSFRGCADLLIQLQAYSADDAMADSRRMAAAQLKLEIRSVSWMTHTVATFLPREKGRHTMRSKDITLPNKSLRESILITLHNGYMIKF
eukprot:1861141-Amphidinium_carterae.1